MDDVVEVTLLLSAEQASELEAAAHQRGATAGELVRRLVRDFLVGQRTATPALAKPLQNHLCSGTSC
jgi:hypothetical protein